MSEITKITDIPNGNYHNDEDDTGDSSQVNFSVHKQIPIHESMALLYLQTVWRIFKQIAMFVNKWSTAHFLK